MINQIIQKIKGFLLKPVETFQKSRGDDVVPVIAYFVFLLIVNGILWALVMASRVMMHPLLTIARYDPGTEPVLVFIIVLILVIVLQLFFILIFGLLLHLFAYITGARKGIVQTEKAVIFGSTPLLLLGWIPVIGTIIGGIWSIILTIIGLRELHGITTGKAILAFVLSLAIIMIILVLIIGWFSISLISGMDPTKAINY